MTAPRLGRVPLRVVASLSLLAALGCSDSDDEGRTPPGDGGNGDAMGSAGNGNGGTFGSGGVSVGNGGDGPAGGSAAGAIGAGGASSAPDGNAPPTCKEEIGARGVSYLETEARGVVDAVELTAPLNGVLIANGTSTEPASDPMACEFVKSLWDFTDLLKARGYDRIGTLGSYCYRCCCASSSTNFCRGPDDPEPDCSVDGFSNHSWGRAVDVRYLYKTDGTRYDVNDPAHFVEWTGTGETCIAALPAQTGISGELYDLVCEASASRIFTTILTPNYNAVHRNHFHLDIGESGPASGFFVRSHGLPSVDVGSYGDE